MEPHISSLTEENGELKFTINNIDASLANGLRRIILSEISTFVFRTFPYEQNKATITTNTTRLNNEILKQRLSCIPIHIADVDFPFKDYIIEIDKKNESDTIEYITTKDFKIKNITNDKYLVESETRKIFPPNNISGEYIDFVRLQPRLSDDIDGEQLSLTCEFDIGNAKESGTYNVVSTCSYAATVDPVAINDVWTTKEKELKSQGTDEDEIEFQKKNWHLLEGQRLTISNSFDFIIKSIGIFNNIDLVKKACQIMINKNKKLISDIEGGKLSIKRSETTMSNSFDIVLENEDYTLGKAIEYFIYAKHYIYNKTLSFCGFRKAHPHDKNSIIRITFIQPSDKTMASSYISDAANESTDVFKKIIEQIQPDE